MFVPIWDTNFLGLSFFFPFGLPANHRKVKGMESHMAARFPFYPPFQGDFLFHNPPCNFPHPFCAFSRRRHTSVPLPFHSGFNFSHQWLLIGILDGRRVVARRGGGVTMGGGVPAPNPPACFTCIKAAPLKLIKNAGQSGAL